MNNTCKKSIRAVLGLIIALVAMFTWNVISFAEVTEGSQVKVISDGTRLRSNADKNSEIVNTLSGGKILTVTGIVTDAEGSDWYQITYNDDSNGQTYSGYVRSDLVEFYADAAPTEEVVDETAVDTEGAVEGDGAAPEDTSGPANLAVETNVLTPMDSTGVPEPKLPAGFVRIEEGVTFSDAIYPAYQNGNYRIIYGSDTKHTEPGWFVLEHFEDGTNVSIRYEESVFASEQTDANATGQVASSKITVVLVVIIVVLVIFSLVLGIKLINKSSDDEFDDDDDDDDEDDDDDDDDDDEIGGRKKKGFFSKFSHAFEDDEDDDYDDDDDEDDEYVPVKKNVQRRPVTSEARPAQQRVASQGRPAPQGQRPTAQGQRPVAQGQRPVQQSRPATQGQRPVQQSRPAAGGQRVVPQGQRPTAQGQRPVAQGQRPVSQGQRTVQGQRPTQRRVVPQNRPQRQVGPSDDYNE